MVSSSSRKAKKHSEFGVGGKYTSSDGESSPAEKYTTYNSGGGEERRSYDEHYNGPNVLSAENERKEARARRIAPYKNTLIGFGVHVVIFILGMYLKLYNDLNTMHLFQTVEEVKTEIGFFIILPFSAANPTLGNIFGSLYLILPLFIYYFASGKKGLIVFPIVLALILLGFYLGFPISGPILI